MFTWQNTTIRSAARAFQVESLRPYQNKIGDTFRNAIQSAGVKRVPFLSGLGAQVPDKIGPIAGLHDVEGLLNGLNNVHVLHSRPAFFMENLFGSIRRTSTFHRFPTFHA